MNNFDMPPVTTALILSNVVLYLAQMLFGSELLFWFALWPLGIDPRFGVSFEIWQPVTYAFLHGGLWHLFVNMFAVFMFGGEIERLFGSRRYLLFYTVCVLTAAAAQLIVASMAVGPPYPTIGASGGVFGILLAFGMSFPHRRVMLMFPPIPMPAWLFVTLYGVFELYMGVTGAAPGVAHFAHLGGMVGGLAVILWMRSQRPRRRW